LGPGGNAGAGRFRGPAGFQPPGGFAGRAPGNFLNASSVSPELAALLEQNASSYRWVAATINANSAASYELATGLPVMAIGGFNGSDPAPTLAEFQDYVSKGQVHYFIGGGGGMRGGGASAGQIESWVSQNFTATTAGGVTIYDLTKPVS
jgi:4-amino-4-deoxy-L-arabinose transferase-like glycosyltransferase